MLLLGSWLLLIAPKAEALIFFSTSDSAFNTTEPTGSLANSGWQWQGTWSGGLGTAIGPHHFVTAKHLGGAIGDVFTLGTTPYFTLSSVDSVSSDLRIWEVLETLPSWAELYRSPDELGKPLVVMGFGVSRGPEVRVSDVLKGWEWGTGAGTLRWGENVVVGTNNYGPNIGPLLKARFDAGANANEAHLASNDSGGGVFIQEGGQWKLAGINYAVDGNFNTSTNGNGFSAALFDVGGLYVGWFGHWTFIQDQAYDIPSAFYATRVSVHAAWIDSVLGNNPPMDSEDVPLINSLTLSTLGFALSVVGSMRLRSHPREPRT